jgi:PhnB protein
MAKRSLIEQLDEAVQAMLAQSDAQLPSVDSSLVPLLRVAADLRNLPREEFKMRLKAELQELAAPKTTHVGPIPKGYRTITPYIVVQQAAELIDFVKGAFAGEETFRSIGPAGGIHCEVQVGDSKMMIGGGGQWKGTPMPTSIHLYVKDADAVYRRALAAGATSLHEPVDQFYGDREASVRDVGGNHWYIATHKATGEAPEGMNTVTVFLHPKGAPDVIAFLERAFDAEVVERHASPDGVIRHANLKIGTSMLEMGEAHGPYQPMPTMFYLYVDRVDAWYARALEAGARSLHAPADQPYGDRNAGVEDPFGNQWYLATHVKDVAH